MKTVTTAKITPKHDQKGVTVRICEVEWFESNKNFAVENPTEDAKEIQYSGSDLNYLSRVLYAESTGQGSCPDRTLRLREKLAIVHVCYFRIARKGYPSAAYVAKSFGDVVKAPGQFESVFKSSRKLVSSDESICDSLRSKECEDLNECLVTVRSFLAAGPDFRANPFDKFLAATGRIGWTKIGNNEFGLFPSMQAAMAKAQK